MTDRARSSELSGGEGFTYEDTAVVYYLTALLRDDEAAGAPGRVIAVSVQQATKGEPLDDLIVDLDAIDGERRLSLQVKRQLTISAAASNEDFRTLIVNAKLTRAKPTFRVGRDRYGFFARSVGDDRLNGLKRLITWAEASPTGADFEARFNGQASQAEIALRAELSPLIGAADAEAERDFYAHFVALRMDGLEEGGDRYAEMSNRLGELAADGQGRVFSGFLCRHARIGAGAGKVWTRPILLAEIRTHIRLKSAPSYTHDVATLTGLAKAYAADIREDIGGVPIAREALVVAAEAAAEKFQFVNLSGLPGCGKSVVLRRVVERAIANGPVLFLKSDRLAAVSWPAFAQAHGLKHLAAKDLLAEIGAAGAPILFIDGVDRIKPADRGVITDLLHAIAAEPALSHWRVMASSRDQGLEAFRQWLPPSAYRATGIGDVPVGLLDDAESEALSEARPYLRALLFGDEAVREIARRPFFAAVLADQFAHADAEAVAPQTENELIAAWWRAGGYNALPEAVLERQRALIDLAEKGAPSLGKLIGARQLRDASVSHAHALKSDRIIDIVEEGSVFSFAHDIFFEWSFFRLLIDKAADWRDAIIAAGEAPLLARVVGLLSQHWFEGGKDWGQEYANIDGAALRPQWKRSWLLGPPASSKFADKLAVFEAPLFAHDASLVEKFLVWFQAERTIPNALLLQVPNTALEGAALVRAADAFGWPSDFALWRRVLTWILAREQYFKPTAIVHAVDVFAVFQNMWGDYANPLSKRIVATAEAWLLDLEKTRIVGVTADRWSSLTDEARGALMRALRQLILRSGRAYPENARALVERAIAQERRSQKLLDIIFAFSPILAQVCAETLADLVRAEVYEQLPQERLDAEREEYENRIARLKELRAKSEGERTPQEQRYLDSPHFFSSMGSHSFSFDDLGIDRHHSSFFPATPINQPFASLFELAPDVARKLVRDMSNRATTAWRQLPVIEPNGFATPIPLDIQFPWGAQRLWGEARTYAWFQGAWAAQPLESAYLALAYWAHKRLDAGDDPDELIRLVVEGHDNWAVLGLAGSIALESLHVSATTLPLVACQRLWHVDLSRSISDPGRPFSLPGLGVPDRTTDTQKAAFDFLLNRRSRKRSIRDLTALFIVGPDTPLSEKLAAALKEFPNDLPFGFEEERKSENRQRELLQAAKIWATWGDRDNYEIAPAEEPGLVAVTFEAPEESRTEEILERQRASDESMRDITVVGWVDQSFKNEALQPQYTLAAIIDHARRRDRADMMAVVEEAGEGFQQSAVAAAGAAAMTFSDDPAEIAWGRSVLARVLVMESKSGPFEDSKNPLDPRLYMATALFHCLKRGCAEPGDAAALLGLAAGDNAHVGEHALTALLRLKDHPRLTFIAGALASELFCAHISPTRKDGGRDRSDDRAHAAAALARARAALTSDATVSFAAPPAPWEFSSPPRRSYEKSDPPKTWRRPSFFFEQRSAAALLRNFPLEAWLDAPEYRPTLLAYAEALMHWTTERLYPAWKEKPDRDRPDAEMSQWLHALSDFVVRLVPFIGAQSTLTNFIQPVGDRLDEDGLRYVAGVASSVVCRYVYDAEAISADALAVVEYCTKRMLRERVFVRTSYSAGEIRGLDLAPMIQSLLFVSVTGAHGAARFANGEWRDVGQVLPLVDELMSAAGWVTYVMETYLTLAERAGGALPVDAFVRHVMANIEAQNDHPQEWREGAILARIAGVVQGLAEANYPLRQDQAHDLLTVLDRLVDLGDRRAAALQQSEYFRGVQLQRRAA